MTVVVVTHPSLPFALHQGRQAVALCLHSDRARRSIWRASLRHERPEGPGVQSPRADVRSARACVRQSSFCEAQDVLHSRQALSHLYKCDSACRECKTSCASQKLDCLTHARADRTSALGDCTPGPSGRSCRRLARQMLLRARSECRQSATACRPWCKANGSDGCVTTTTVITPTTTSMTASTTTTH